MRIAVLIKDRCKPKNCAYECIKFCPRVRAGDETIIQGEDGRPVISEDLCAGCGICVHFCPHGVLEMSEEFTPKGYHPPQKKKGAVCKGCRICEQMCPDLAIFIEEEAK